MFNVVGENGEIQKLQTGYLYSIDIQSGKSNEESHLEYLKKELKVGEKLVLVSEKSYGIGEG